MAWWFLSLAFLGALYAAAFASRLLVSLTLLCLHPPKPKDLRCYGPWAVVTGPTSGIDRSVALELARRGLNLLLVEVANLQEISDAVRSRYAVKTAAVVSDLSLDVATPQGAEAARRLQDAVEALDVGVLVNNAGVVTPGAVFFHEADVEEWMRMIRVNLWGLTEVTAAVLPGMVRRGRGAVLNMGSASSEAIPSFPLYTIYTATKRYVAQFSSSLYAEYSKGIDVQCQAPFFVATTMVTGFSGIWRPSAFVPTPDAYARAAVPWIGLGRGGPLCVPNLSHRILWCLLAAVPGSIHDWVCLREHLRQRRSMFRKAASLR